MTRFLAAVALLTLVYALTLASADPLDLALGAAASAALLAALRPRLGPGTPGPGPLALLRRVVAFVPLAAVVVRDITVGTWQVALVVLGLRPLAGPGIVAVPIGERTPLGVAVSGLAATLSPGEFLVDVDRERGVMLLHVLDARDPEAVRARHEHFYRRYQRHVFP